MSLDACRDSGSYLLPPSGAVSGGRVERVGVEEFGCGSVCMFHFLVQLYKGKKRNDEAITIKDSLMPCSVQDIVGACS